MDGLNIHLSYNQHYWWLYSDKINKKLFGLSVSNDRHVGHIVAVLLWTGIRGPRRMMDKTIQIIPDIWILWMFLYIAQLHQVSLYCGAIAQTNHLWAVMVTLPAITRPAILVWQRLFLLTKESLQLQWVWPLAFGVTLCGQVTPVKPIILLFRGLENTEVYPLQLGNIFTLLRASLHAPAKGAISISPTK